MHNKPGYAGEALTRNTAKHIGYKIIDKSTKCESYLMGKMKQ